MSKWQFFLNESGVVSEQPHALSFGETPAHYPALLTSATVTPLIHHGLMSIDGPDSARFLQGQLTCDVLKLGIGESEPGACCNAKGRMLSNFILYRVDEHHFLLQMHHSLVKPTLEHMAKYAVFFKTALTDASEQYLLLGLSSAAANTSPPTIKPFSSHTYSDGRKLLLIEESCAHEIWRAILNTAQPVGTELWQLWDIHAGLGYVQAETMEMFIPQMLNLQSINAISFKKGCYTGQEVVARMKYLGKLKRHMYRVFTPDTESPPLAGTPCYLPGGEQSIGNVVLAARYNHGVEMLIVLTDDAAIGQQLVIGDGTAVSTALSKLPYSID